MSQRFHFLQGTTVQGPLQLDELRRLVEKGVVSKDSLLSDDGQKWQKAGELLPSLFVKPISTSGSASGAEQWFVQAADGKHFGPISYTELLSWVMGGNVTATTQVRTSSQSRWQRADEVFPQLKTSASPTPRVIPTTQPEWSIAVASDKPSRPVGGSRRDTPTSEKVQRNPDDGEKALAWIGIIAVYAIVIIGGYFVITALRPMKIGPFSALAVLFVVGGIIVRVISSAARKR